MTSFFAFTK